MPGSSPRLFGITATHAEVVAVIRRGPSSWCHVGRWDTARRQYQSGAWLKGKLYPQRCDLSPDGEWLCSMIFKGNNPGALGECYIGLSKLPWLTALCAWRLDSSYSRGLHFVGRDDDGTTPPPDVGRFDRRRCPFALTSTKPAQFAVELRRGWSEAADSPPRHAGDMWDEGRQARVQKQQPRAKRPVVLTATGRYAAFRDMGNDGKDVVYTLSEGDRVEPLAGVQWADWSRSGDLVVATSAGTLEQWRVAGLSNRTRTFEEDLTTLVPDPCAAPDSASRW